MSQPRAQLAELIVHSTPSAEARGKARAGVLDYVSVALPIVTGAIEDKPLSSLLAVFSEPHNAQTMALLLGYAGHTLDFDDFHQQFHGHPSAVILPALFALARDCSSRLSVNKDELFDGEHFLDAYVIGVEVAGRLGLAAGPQHYQAGFHNTATLGTLAAAAAAARFMHADVAQTAMIIGIAATRASGLRAQFGSSVKPLHAGYAAEAAVIATKLVLAGFDGKSAQVIEAFLSSHGGGKQQPEKLTADWAQPWRIITPGLEFKPYPTCAGTHSAADAAFALRARWLADSGKPLNELTEDINHIVVAFPPGGDIAASVRNPATGIEARFSLEYVIAAVLLRDRLSLEDFDQRPVDEEIMALARKVIRQPDEAAPRDEIDPTQRFHEVTLSRKNGEIWATRVTRKQSVAKGVDQQLKLQGCLPKSSAAEWAEIEALCQLATPAALPELAKRLTSFKSL